MIQAVQASVPGTCGFFCFSVSPSIRSLSFQSVKSIFSSSILNIYTPLTALSFAIEYHFVKDQPFVYHLDNLLWHMLNACLVLWLVYLISENGWVAFSCAVLFSVHPMNTEAVVWASARKDVLSTAFFLLSLLSYIYYRSDHRRWIYVCSWLFFLCALLSKVTTVILPVIFLLSDFRRKRSWSVPLLVEKLPFFLLSVLFIVIAWFGKFAIPLFCLIWNPVRRSVWGPPTVSLVIIIGTFFDRVRLYTGPFSVPDEELKHHILEQIPAIHLPDLADILIMVGWAAGVVLVYLLASRIIPTISVWEMKEGMLLHREREYIRSKVAVLGKPQ